MEASFFPIQVGLNERILSIKAGDNYCTIVISFPAQALDACY